MYIYIYIYMIYTTNLETWDSAFRDTYEPECLDACLPYGVS